MNLGIKLNEHWPFPSAQGKIVYERTYSRTKSDGKRETWIDTVRRVAEGNLSFVYGSRDSWSDEVKHEYNRLVDLMSDFSVIPAGRHLWATGVPGRQFVSNCFVSHWTPQLSDHFSFTLLRLAEGGGVGANYSTKHTGHYPVVSRALDVHIVCDPEHPDYQAMKDAGFISDEYHHEWPIAYPVQDTREGWAEAMSDLLDTFMKEAPVKHQNRVYDVSRLRPKGSPLRTFGGTASGPFPFAKMMIEIGQIISAKLDKKLTAIDLMEIDHEIAACVVAGGNRRSARMSIVHWNDPSIFEFLKCKTDPTKHWTTNISVEVDDEFINAINNDEFQIPMDMRIVDPWNVLKNYSKAHRVYKAIIQGMLTNGEPGMWNSSLSNVGEPNEVVSTNPCGEVVLEPWESCILGHVNMEAFVGRDHEDLEEAHRLMTRFLIRATYGTMNDPKQAAVVARNRRIGVGHFGVQGYLAKNGEPISHLRNKGYLWFPALLKTLRETCRDEARKYAFQLRIPEPVKVTTVAPTGTIAKMPGVSEGIHPIYARYFIRRIRFSTIDPKESSQLATLVEAGYDVEPCMYAADTMVVSIPTKEKLVEEIERLGLDPNMVVESADEIHIEDMLKLQEIYQEHYADNAVSFTVNVPERFGISTQELNEALFFNPQTMGDKIRYVGNAIRSKLHKLKGTTLMVDNSRQQAPYERITEDEYLEMSGPKTTDDGTNEECGSGGCPVR